MDLTTTVSSVGGSDLTWLRSDHGLSNAVDRTLDITKFTSGTHYDAVTKILKSGIPLAKVTATGLYGPYDTTAADGRQLKLDSYSLYEQNLLLDDGTTSVKIAAAAGRHLIINAALLPIAANRPGGASDVTTATTDGSFVYET